MDRTKLTEAQWATIWAFLMTYWRVYAGRPETNRRFLEAVLTLPSLGWIYPIPAQEPQKTANTAKG